MRFATDGAKAGIVEKIAEHVVDIRAAERDCRCATGTRTIGAKVAGPISIFPLRTGAIALF